MMGFGTGLITFLNDDGSPMTSLDIEQDAIECATLEAL